MAIILRSVGIQRMGPLEIHLDSLKINLENLHQASGIASPQFEGCICTAKVESACWRFGCA